MAQSRKVLRYPDAAAVAKAAADLILPILQSAVDKPVSMALSGGNTPKRLYRILGEEPYKSLIPWNLVNVFLTDERYVPQDHEDSNFKMVRKTLLDLVPIPGANVHAIATELPPEAAASAYQLTLETFFGTSPPIFDLMVLGMGPDGHTASLFPGRDLASNQLVTPIYESPKPPPTRLTLTLPLINQSRNVIFLVTGADKSPAVKSIVAFGEQSGLPAASVLPKTGRLTWLLDEAAAP